MENTGDGERTEGEISRIRTEKQYETCVEELVRRGCNFARKIRFFGGDAQSMMTLKQKHN
jgi:hypothetical protein